jgi:AcrR family transcriptional regulator
MPTTLRRSSQPPPNRRERLRTATIAEIKGVARRLLVAGGAPAVSLRAIAREMGMTAPAIYRYFPGLDALIVELVADFYDELRVEVERAKAATTEPVAALQEMSRAFRRWSIGHPAEFTLVFGSPLPGVVRVDDEICEPDHAGARFGLPFMAAFFELWQQRPFRTPPREQIEARVIPYLKPYREKFGDNVPVEVIYTYLSAWTRLYGLVALEVFGHLHWAVTDAESLFEVEITSFTDGLTAEQ